MRTGLRTIFKWVLLAQATGGYLAVMVFRFVATILVGPDEALAIAQGAAVEFMEENHGLDAMRMLMSPHTVTMPEPDQRFAWTPAQVDAEFLHPARAIVFESGPYKILSTEPPNEHCPWWVFAFTGPGFETPVGTGGGFAFIGCTAQCGESHMGALARAYAAGHAAAPARPEVPCNSR